VATQTLEWPATFTFKLDKPAFSGISPAQLPGTYNGSATVGLTDTNTAATICYTLDGSTPTGSVTGGVASCSGTATGLTYTGTAWPTFTLTAPATVKAIAIAANYSNSAMVSGTYNFTLARPTFSNTPPAEWPGTYSGSATVGLTDTNTTTATICYTLDGSTPTGSGSTCTNGTGLTPSGGAYPTFTLTTPGTYVVSAIAIAPGSTNSSMVAGTYTVN